MIHGLRSIKLAHRWKHTKGVAGQHENVFRVPGNTRNSGVGNVLDGIGTAGILCDRAVIVIDFASDGVNNDILKDASKLDGIKNLGLLVSRQVDAFGIAATFDVEDSVVSPAMLIVANEIPMDVSRQGSLTSARQAKEQSDVIRSISLIIKNMVVS